MNNKLLFKPYVLISSGFALAIMFFLGTTLFNPIETSLFWGVSAFGTINVTFYLIIIVAYLLYLILPTLTSRIKQISDVLLYLSILSALITAVYVAPNNQESWFLSFNFFLRNYGYMIGVVLGLSTASIIGSFQILSKIKKATPTPKQGIIYTSVTIVAFSLFTIMLFGTWRFGSIYSILTAMLITSAIIALGAIFLRSGSLAKDILTDEVVMTSPDNKRCSLVNLNKKNMPQFIISVVFFVLFAGAGIYGIVDKSEILFFPGAPIPGTARGFQIVVILIATLFVIAQITLATFELTKARKAENNGKRGILYAVFRNPVVRVFKSFFEIIGLTVGIYYFCIVMYLPEMFINEAAFMLIGVLIYLIPVLLISKFSKKDYSKLVELCSYAFGVVLFVICMFLLLNDNVNNGVQYIGYVTPTDSFPFKFIHSAGHYALMGIALGIILAYTIRTKFFASTKFNPSNYRAVGLAFGMFLLGLLTVGFGHAIVLLKGAGEWPPTWNMKVSDIPFGTFFTTVFAIMFGLSCATEIIARLTSLRGSSNSTDALSDVKIENRQHEKAISANLKALIAKLKPEKLSYKAIPVAILIASIVFINCVLIIVPLNKTAGRDLVAQGDGYYIWVTDSYEKVMPTAYVPVSGFNKVAAASIDVARNEYASIQLVWKTTSSIKNLNATVSKPRMIADNSDALIDEIELRYARNLYDSTYPEILEPINGQNLESGYNYPLWLSFFTDTDQIPGAYQSTIKFTFEEKGVSKEALVYVNIQVASFALPESSHYFYNLPWTETEYTSAFYSQHRQFLNGATMVDPLINTSWYDTEQKKWDYSKPLSEEVQDRVFKYWDRTVVTGEDLWNAWADIAIESLKTGRTVIRIDYQTFIADDETGIGNPDNWDGEKWTGTVWDASERQAIYDYYYYLNAFLLSKKIPGGTLADKVIVKWKDEWDQPQFFKKSPSGRLLDRAELYKLYELEVSQMYNARAAAVADAGAESGMRMLANVNPIAVNMDILFDYFDIYCPLSYAISDELVNYCHENGKTVWLYTCVQPFLPYANQFAYNQLYETHITQWQVYATRTEGYWLWNSEYRYNSNFFYGFNGYLDGVFVFYEDGKKPEVLEANTFMTGIRFETATESIEEAEMFIMLENILLDLKNNNPDALAFAKEQLSLLNAKIKECTKSMSEWTHDIKKMREVVKWTRATLETIYTTYYASTPEKFDAVVNGSWNTFINPFEDA
ncbi:MAG: hypothetical protein LBE09_04735 [Christensenellaceae bacterium]|jgi:hypothetical protein|nr:hypothetical protein [Christensenellaceae bacterium]